ncbi:hypothetical protein KBB05_03130 [Patescibacteria group bacterium]|nr:hypothetical protein [Patescibacteria group bacterium]
MGASGGGVKSLEEWIVDCEFAIFGELVAVVFGKNGEVWRAYDDGAILFGYVVISDQLIDMLKGRIGFCRYKDSRGILVETIGKSRFEGSMRGSTLMILIITYFIFWIITLLYHIQFQKLIHSDILFMLIALVSDYTHWFVPNQPVIILVQDAILPAYSLCIHPMLDMRSIVFELFG